MQTRQRNIAYKLWISQLHSGQYIHNPEDDLNYLDIDGLNVLRVNIIASITLVSINEGYAYAVIDDASAAIRVKAWQQDTQLISSLNPGDIVLLIGRIKEYNDERYISPEMVRKLDNPNWLLVRKLELLRDFPSIIEHVEHIPVAIKEEIVGSYPSVKPLSNLRSKMLSIIESIDSPEGVSMEQIEHSSGLDRKDIEPIIIEMVKEGEIYEHKPGKLKLLP